jgi:hypothetical protein
MMKNGRPSARTRRAKSAAADATSAELSPRWITGGAPSRLSGGSISKKLSWERYSSKPIRAGFTGDSRLTAPTCHLPK